MPFDAAGFPPAPRGPEHPSFGENVITVLIVMLASVLLAMPVSLPAFVDLARYVQGL